MWGRQLSQAALKYSLHGTTMNRGKDAATTDTVISDFTAFDTGVGASPSNSAAGAAATDGGQRGDD
jgi:glycerol-3-phosphate dehydrogenase